MKTHEIGFGNTYPHYYTITGKNGTGKVTGCYLNDNPIQVGDIIDIKKVMHKVVEIETAPPKSSRHPAPATAYTVVTEYIQPPA